MRQTTKYVCALLLVLGVVGKVQAVPLNDLFAGGSIVVDDKLFSNWTLIDLNVTSGTVDLTQIEVGAISEPSNHGLQFVANGQLSVADDNFIDLFFSYDVATQSGLPLIKDNSLEIEDFAFGTNGGVITILEDVFDAGGISVAAKIVEIDPSFGVSEPFDSALFTPTSFLNVETNIFVFGDAQGDLVSLDVFNQKFSQVSVPEPSTAPLILLGGTLIGFLCKRRRAKRPDR